LLDAAKTKITAHHLNEGKEHAAQGSEVNQMEAKEHDLICDDSDEQLEAKQHDLAFDDPEEEEETSVEANNFKTVQVPNAETARKMCEDEGFNFNMVFQAQQANTRIQARNHEPLDSDSSDEESAADLAVNVHNIRAKIQGLLEFGDSEDENERDPNRSTNTDEALDVDARGKINDPDIPEDQSIEQKTTAKMFKGMLQFSDSEDEEDKDKFQLRACGFTSSIEETVNADGTDPFAGTGNEGVVGEQEGNLSGLTDSIADRRRLIDDFYVPEGLQHFSDSEDEHDLEDKEKIFSNEKAKVGTDKEETKVMTRSEHEKADIAPPPASKAPCPTGRRARSLSPKPTSSEATKATSPNQTSKVPLSTQVAHRQAMCGQGHEVNAVAATDVLPKSMDPQDQPGSKTASQHAPSPKQANTKTFASVASTPKTPVKTQQTSPTAQTPTKPVRAKADAKKTSPNKGKQAPKKVSNQFKRKVDSKPKQVTMSKKLADVDEQIAIEAKQADKSDSPTMKKPFDEVRKPIKTTERIVETPDGEGYQLLSEEEKKKADRDKKFKSMGPFHFSDDEEDESSLETVTSNKSKGSNKSQGSQKLIAKPKPKQPVTPEQPNNLMPRSGSKHVKEDELTPFHKDLLVSAGGLATPDAMGSSAGGWTIHGSGKRTPDICDIFSPKVMGNMSGTRDPAPPNSDSDVGSAGGDNGNRCAALQDD